MKNKERRPSKKNSKKENKKFPYKKRRKLSLTDVILIGYFIVLELGILLPLVLKELGKW